jgi:hypothetical protein
MTETFESRLFPGDWFGQETGHSARRAGLSVGRFLTAADLAEARRIIEQTQYHRRLDELHDADAALSAFK